MDPFLHFLATANEEHGAILFLAHNLGPRASIETHEAALRFTTKGLPDTPEPYALLDFALGLYVLRALGLHHVGQGRRAFSLQRLTERVDTLLSSFTWGEVFGFDVLEDDEDLCDALVWLFVFEHAGLHAFEYARPRVLAALERRRGAYGKHQALRAWQWTSYLVTHVVYVKSSWGLQSPSEPCQAEFIYIVDNIHQAIAQEDVELVGEFLHCLWVLDRPLTPAQQALVQQGKALLAKPLDELWASPRESFYRKFHTAWCVAVGLGEE